MSLGVPDPEFGRQGIINLSSLCEIASCFLLPCSLASVNGYMLLAYCICPETRKKSVDFAMVFDGFEMQSIHEFTVWSVRKLGYCSLLSFLTLGVGASPTI